MIKYTDYINATLPARQADLQANRAQFVELMQQLRNNASAPVVSGSGGSLGGGGGTSGGTTPAANVDLSNQFKTAGGKYVPVAGRVSQGWGKSRIHYAAGRHTGMDFGVGVGTGVRSAANGIVVRAGREGAYGNAIHIRHPDGTTTLYAHLNNINVRPGQRVRGGQSIGRSGNTGRSTGAHLHFEVRTRDRYGSDINPRGWLGR